MRKVIAAVVVYVGAWLLLVWALNRSGRIREADAAFAAWEERQRERQAKLVELRARQAEHRRLSLVDADLLVREAREHDWQTVGGQRRTTRLDWLSFDCSALRHHLCRPDRDQCHCQCHSEPEAS